MDKTDNCPASSLDPEAPEYRPPGGLLGLLRHNSEPLGTHTQSLAPGSEVSDDDPSSPTFNPSWRTHRRHISLPTAPGSDDPQAIPKQGPLRLSWTPWDGPSDPATLKRILSPPDPGTSGPGRLRRSQTAPGRPISSTTKSYAAVLRRPVQKDSQISQCTVAPGRESHRRFLPSHSYQTPIKGSQTLSDTPGSFRDPPTSGPGATGLKFLPSGGNGVTNGSVAGTEWPSGSRLYAGKVAAREPSGLDDRHGRPSSMSYAAALTGTRPAVDSGATPTSPTFGGEVKQPTLASSADGDLPVLQHGHQAHDSNLQNALAIRSYAVALTSPGAAEKDEPSPPVEDGWNSTCKVTFRRKPAPSS